MYTMFFWVLFTRGLLFPLQQPAAALFVFIFFYLGYKNTQKFNSRPLFTFSHYGVDARGSIVFTRKIDLLLLPDLHVLKIRIQKKWFLGVGMSVCLSDEYLANYLTDLDHISLGCFINHVSANPSFFKMRLPMYS